MAELLPVPQMIGPVPHEAHVWGPCIQTKFRTFRRQCTVLGCGATTAC